jgi:hypothetical protein
MGEMLAWMVQQSFMSACEKLHTTEEACTYPSCDVPAVLLVVSVVTVIPLLCMMWCALLSAEMSRELSNKKDVVVVSRVCGSRFEQSQAGQQAGSKDYKTGADRNVV